MFKQMRRKDRQLDLEQTIKVLENGEYGVLSVTGENGYAYGVPLSYVYFDNAVYFHGAKTGSKLDAIQNNNKVSFCVVGKTKVLPDKFSTNYESTIVFGIAKEVFEQEKNNVLLELIKKYSKEYIEQGKEYIERAAENTKVIKIDINHVSGKGRS